MNELGWLRTVLSESLQSTNAIADASPGMAGWGGGTGTETGTGKHDLEGG